MHDESDMIWEGGPVVHIWKDEEWEPSESEVFAINDTDPKLLLSAEELKYRFTCLISDAIRHVKKFFFNRVEVGREKGADQPTTAQQVGEFVTEIRRLLRGQYADVNFCFRDLTNTEMWVNVAWPSPKNEYRWKYAISTTTGLFFLDLPTAKILCENAAKMATSDKTSDEEFREINSTLNDLMRETTALDALVYKAKDINAQASTVVDNLCVIAEKLQESTNG